MKILTGNDLKSGAVTWWDGTEWSLHVEDAVDVGEHADPVIAREQAARRVNAAYAIDAPTARRFAKQGDAAELIAAAQSPEALQWAMQAIDPCVEWAIAQEEPA